MIFFFSADSKLKTVCMHSRPLWCPDVPAQAPDGPAERAFVGQRHESKRGLSFAEFMTGFIQAGHEISDYDAGEDAARTQQLYAQCFLTVDAFDNSLCDCCSIASNC